MRIDSVRQHLNLGRVWSYDPHTQLCALDSIQQPFKRFHDFVDLCVVDLTPTDTQGLSSAGYPVYASREALRIVIPVKVAAHLEFTFVEALIEQRRNIILRSIVILQLHGLLGETFLSSPIE